MSDALHETYLKPQAAQELYSRVNGINYQYTPPPMNMVEPVGASDSKVSIDLRPDAIRSAFSYQATNAISNPNLLSLNQLLADPSVQSQICNLSRLAGSQVEGWFGRS